MKRKTKAQSIVEYLLVFGGLVLVALFAARLLSQRGQENANMGSEIVNQTGNHLNTAFGGTLREEG